MFYSHDILGKKGKFGMIWMAAMHRRKITNRNCWTVRVAETCEEILKYLPNRGDRKGKMKFSLYLQSQLMYGVVVISDLQHKFFLAEVREAQQRLIRNPIRVIAVDIDTVFPDVDLRWEQDIDWSILGIQDASRHSTPSLSNLEDYVSASMKSGQTESSDQSGLRYPEGIDPMLVDRITLTEKPSFSLTRMGLQPEAEDDLIPPENPNEIEEFLEEMLSQERERDAAKEREDVFRVPSPEFTPGIRMEEGIPEPPLAPVRGSQEQIAEVTTAEEPPKETTPPKEKEGIESTGFELSPVGQKELEEETRRRATKRRRRAEKGPIVDEVTMFTKEVIQNNVATQDDTLLNCMRIAEPVERLPPSRLLRDAAVLPRGGRALEKLWEELAVAPPKVDVDIREVWRRDPWESLEHMEQAVYQEERGDVAAEQGPEFQTEEVPEKRMRVSPEHVVQVGEEREKEPEGNLPLDEDEAEKLREAESRKSSLVYGSKRVSGALPRSEGVEEDMFMEMEEGRPSMQMEPLIEETETTRGTADEASKEAERKRRDTEMKDKERREERKKKKECAGKDTPEDIPYARPVRFDMRADLVLSEVERVGEDEQRRIVMFEEICPPESKNRYEAAKMFSVILSLAKNRKMTLKQKESYGPIFLQLTQ